MAIIIFENLFPEQKLKIQESYKHCSFLEVKHLKQILNENFYNFINQDSFKIIFFNNQYFSKNTFIKNLPEEKILYYHNPKWKIDKIIYMPYRFKKIIHNLKNMRQFNSFSNSENAKYCIVEGSFTENKFNSKLLKIFLFWLLCIGVAFFWEKRD